MKRITASMLLLAALLPLSLVSHAAKKTARQQLIERLAKLQKRGYMYGHQDDTFYGITWDWDEGRSDTYELVGDYPAVMGFDLGGIEKGDLKNLDSVPFTRIRQAIIDHHARGGIVTISWHPRNPMLGTTAWIENDIKAYDAATDALRRINQHDMAARVPNPKHTVKAVIPGGVCHPLFNEWLKRVTDFLA